MSERSEMLEDVCVAANALTVGETLRMNHTRCTAGEDTRRRLYVTRKADVLLGYCHNCQQSVSKYVAPDDRFRKDVALSTSVVKPILTNPLIVPFNDKDNIPREAEAWRFKSKLSRKLCDEWKIGYCPEYNAIYLPFYWMDGSNDGFQLRPLDKQSTAKYVNHVWGHDDAELGGRLFAHGIAKNICVIVEDLVSAIHIAEAGYDALVNYGTAVKPTVLYELSKEKYDQIIVWLDNDSDLIIKKAAQMTNVLNMYSPNIAGRITSHADPKKFTEAEITEVIDNGHA